MALKPKKQKRPRRHPKSEDPLRPELREAYERHRHEVAMMGVELPHIPVNEEESKEVKKKVALLWLMKGYSKARSAQEAGFSYWTLCKWPNEDAEWLEQIRQAMVVGTQYIEDEARRRAVDGVDRPVFQQGECVGFVREYSDQLMAQILSARNPAYNRSRVEHTGAEGGPVKYEVEVTFSDGTEDKPDGK